MQKHEARGSSQTEITTGGTHQLKALVGLIGDDAFAMSFQSVRQYREALLNAAPAVQGEPVGWQFYQHGEWWAGDDTIKDHKKTTEEAGFRVRDVYAEPPAVQGEPVAWMHDSPGRVDVIHAEVKKLLVDSHDAAGHLHRTLDKSEHYTVPLYAAPKSEGQQPKCCTCRDSGFVGHNILCPECVGSWLLPADQQPAQDVDVLVDASDRAAPAMNEHEKMKNAMQLAQGPKPTTLGELHDYLDSIRKAWSAQDTKYLGSYESQPLYILPNDPTPGFHLAEAKYFAEFGLTFIPVEGASK